jgi:hypothetical protein
MVMYEKYQKTRWVDINKDIESLTEISHQVSRERAVEPQNTYTGKIELNFDEIQSIKFTPEEEVAFHTPSTGGISQKMHEGMITGNWVGKHHFDDNHEIHKPIQEKFGITKTQAVLNVQRPGYLCGVHIDKHRNYTVNGTYDFSNTLTENIFRGIIFCNDWELGQVFITGHETITNWKQGDTYVFPWYMFHGSANASAGTRHLIMFMGDNGELTKK